MKIITLIALMLFTALGYAQVGINTNNPDASSALEIESTTGGIGNDQGLNNSSGFNAFPEGYRFNGASFNDEGNFALFWSSSEYIGYNAWYRILYYDNGSLPRSYDYFKQDGFSVRFVRD